MTDKEKIQRHDTIDEIRSRIGGCFGIADGIFAEHTLDKDRAKELRKLAANNKLKLEEVKEIALAYLYGKGFDAEDLSERMDKVTTFFDKKLQ